MSNPKFNKAPLAAAVAAALSINAYGACPENLTVTDATDALSPAAGSLRAHINTIDAAGCPGADHTITFDASLNGSTIGLVDGLDINSNVTITGPGASQLTIGRSGSASVPSTINSDSADVKLVGLTISGHDESAVWSYGPGSLTLDSVIIENNAALYDGGGVKVSNYGARQTLTITDSVIRNNTANAGTTYTGGGIYISGDVDVDISNSVISGNTAGAHGAGIYIAGTTTAGRSITIDGVSIDDNTSASGNGNPKGTGIHITTTEANTISIQDTSITNNTIVNSFNSDTLGAGLYILDNAATVSTIDIIQSTISNNEHQGISVAGVGGGMYLTFNEDDTVSIQGSTITENTAANGGGFTFTQPDVATTSDNFTVTNTIIANNTALTDTDANNFQGRIDVANDSYIGEFATYGSVGTENGGSVNIGGSDAALDLRELADNGGITKTHVPDSDSPVVDAGNWSTAGAEDQRGEDRVINGTIDIGAVEYNASVDESTSSSKKKKSSGGITGFGLLTMLSGLLMMRRRRH